MIDNLTINEINEKIKNGESILRSLLQLPVGQLKDLDIEQLDGIRKYIIQELSKTGTALHWLDGIIRLKEAEQTEK